MEKEGKAQKHFQIHERKKEQPVAPIYGY